jgi:hypothetical protein
MKTAFYQPPLQSGGRKGVRWTPHISLKNGIILRRENEALCIAALEDAPEHLEKIPDELKTFNVCFATVYHDDGVLQFVPQSLIES